MDQRVFVALALDAALALGKVSRTPRTIQVMEGHKAVLHIGASAHFRGAAQQNTHLPGPYLGKQFFFRTSVLASWIKAIWLAGIPGR